MFPPLDQNNYAMANQLNDRSYENETKSNQSLIEIHTDKNHQRINAKPNLCDKIISTIKTIAKKIMQALQKLFSTFKNLFVDDEDYDKNARLEIQQLIPEIAEIKDKIKRLDNFIKSKPELEKKCLEYIENNKDIVSITTPKLKLENFDPNNPVDQRANLKIEKNQLEYLINKRIRFIGYFPELYDLFVKCVFEEQKNNKIFKNPLLIENV